ncbi:MAG: hypothetical protein HY216_00085 [Candidatus Rokubacteria bacterium]|nr:hypothetical protein [Candidatus Rokubacteria bacterium]
MTDVNRLFATLQDLSDTLNRESDSLTTEIIEFESRLIQLKLGILLWYHEPVRQHLPQTDDDEERQTATYLVFAKGNGGWGLYLRSWVVGQDPETTFFDETRLRDAVREDRVAAVKLFPGFLEAMAEAARARVELVRQGRDEAQRVNAGEIDRAKATNDAAKGAAMLAVVLDVWEGGKDLIQGWRLRQNAEDALARGGVEGLRRYYESCLRGGGTRVRLTLERNGRKTLESEYARFMSIYRGN